VSVPEVGQEVDLEAHHPLTIQPSTLRSPNNFFSMRAKLSKSAFQDATAVVLRIYKPKCNVTACQRISPSFKSYNLLRRLLIWKFKNNNNNNNNSTLTSHSKVKNIFSKTSAIQVKLFLETLL
jgi:hypothetical protein